MKVNSFLVSSESEKKEINKSFCCLTLFDRLLFSIDKTSGKSVSCIPNTCRHTFLSFIIFKNVRSGRKTRRPEAESSSLQKKNELQTSKHSLCPPKRRRRRKTHHRRLYSPKDRQRWPFSVTRKNIYRKLQVFLRESSALSMIWVCRRSERVGAGVRRGRVGGRRKDRQGVLPGALQEHSRTDVGT